MPQTLLTANLSYLLLDRTNLVSGITHTNHWDSQTVGLINGDYAVVSNHYEVAAQERLFIQLHVQGE